MFVCKNCNREVNEDALGTDHRNHCPHCLYSFHLDEDSPGDRMSDCKGLMEPIGLQFKNESGEKGEIMIVHKCESSGSVSKNRIAGDDEPESILKVFKKSVDQDSNVNLLGIDEEKEVLTQLFGKPWVDENFNKPK